MKRNMLIPVAGLALATALLVSASVWVSADRQVVWGHTEGITQDEIMEKLHQLTTADFLKDFDQAMEDIQNGKGDPDLGVCWGQVCIERASEFSDDEIINRIEEGMDDAYLRQWWVEMFYQKYPQEDHNHPRLLKLLQDEHVDPSFKTSLIHFVGFRTPEEMEVLRMLTQDADKNLRFRAMNRLNEIDQKSAVDMAKKAVAAYHSKGDMEQLPEAIDILVQQMQNGASREEKDEIIALCNELLDSDLESAKKDSLVYDMQMLSDLEALRMVVQHPKVDNIMKKGMIDNNYYLLEEVLLNDPTPQDVEFTVTCMELLPIKDLYMPLKTAIEAMPQTRNASGNNWQILLQNMQEEGVDAKTWLKEDWHR